MKTLSAFLLLNLTFASFSLAAGKVKFKVLLSPAGSFTAEAATVSGSAYPAGAGFKAENVTLKIDDLKTGIDLRDEHMNKNYFESEQFPTATLKSAEGAAGKFTGQLEVHGVTRPIAGDFKVEGQVVKAEFKTKMSEYGIKKASYSGLGVKDDINVEVEIPVGAAPQVAAPVAQPAKDAAPAPKAAPAKKGKK